VPIVVGYRQPTMKSWNWARTNQPRLAAFALFLLSWLGCALVLGQDDAACGAMLSRATLVEMVHKSSFNYTELMQSAKDYLRLKVLDKVKDGCRFVSLTSNSLSKVLPPMVNATDLASPNAAKKPRSAIVFTQNSAERLEKHLSMYPLHLLAHWFYAIQHGYDVLLYTRAVPMPPKMTGHFSKIHGIHGALFRLGYDLVLGVDWDSYVDPLAAVPIEQFAVEWPKAGLLLQFEQNMCSCVIIYRRSPRTLWLLDEWWTVGRTGDFTYGIHDQAALKHIMQQHLVNITGSDLFFPPGEPGSRNEPPQVQLATFLLHKRQIAAESVFGFVGLHVPHRMSQVSLHSCGGRWVGCIPAEAPALVQHHGHHHYYVRDYMPRLMEALRMWILLPEPSCYTGN
jgi:hypothetical protein